MTTIKTPIRAALDAIANAGNALYDAQFEMLKAYKWNELTAADYECFNNSLAAAINYVENVHSGVENLVLGTGDELASH